jgi:hypothetical protein
MTVQNVNDHVGAAEVIRQAFKNIHGRWPTETERALAQAVAHLETYYGRGGQFASWPSRGLYNWGNVEHQRNGDGSCPDGYEPGQDQGPVCFRVFPTDVEAATHYLRVLTDSNYGSAAIKQRNVATLAALATGDPYAVAHAMKTGGGSAAAYFAADEAGYASGIATRLGLIDAVVPRVAPRRVPIAPIFMVLGVVAVLYVAHRNGRVHLPAFA